MTRCLAVPDGYVLSAQWNPLKRLLRWAWRTCAIFAVAGAVGTVLAVIEASGECRGGRVSRYAACAAERDDAEALAWVLGSITAGLVFWAVVLAACCWLAREWRTHIKPDLSESEHP